MSVSSEIQHLLCTCGRAITPPPYEDGVFILYEEGCNECHINSFIKETGTYDNELARNVGIILEPLKLKCSSSPMYVLPEDWKSRISEYRPARSNSLTKVQ